MSIDKTLASNTLMHFDKLSSLQSIVDDINADAFYAGELTDENFDGIFVRREHVEHYDECDEKDTHENAFNIDFEWLIEFCCGADDTTFWMDLVDNNISYRRIVLALNLLLRMRDKNSYASAITLLRFLSVSGNCNVFQPIVIREIIVLIQLLCEDNAQKMLSLGIGNASFAITQIFTALSCVCRIHRFNEGLHLQVTSIVTDILQLTSLNISLPVTFELLKCLTTDAGQQCTPHYLCVLRLLVPIIIISRTKKLCADVRERSLATLNCAISWLSIVSHDDNASLVLFEHLCVSCIARSEHRTHCCVIISKLLEQLPHILHDSAIFITKLTRSAHVHNRILAVEMAPIILTRFVANDTLIHSIHSSPMFLLLDALRQRGSDKSANVRARALQSLADAVNLSSSSSMLRAHFAALLTHVDTSVSSVDVDPTRSSGARSPFHHRCTGTRRILELLRRRTHDAKTLVRQAALHALAAVIFHHDEDDGIFFVSREDLQVFCNACTDTSVALRKAALQHLTAVLVRRIDDARVKLAWLNSVLPLCDDTEMSVQNACLVAVQCAVITPLSGDDAARHRAALSVIECGNAASRVRLQNVIALLCERRTLSSAFIVRVNALIAQNTTNIAVWCILAELAKHVPAQLHLESIVSCFNTAAATSSSSSCVCAVYMHDTIARTASFLEPHTRTHIANEIHQRLTQCQINLPLISSCVKCYVALQNTINDACHALLLQHEQELHTHVFTSQTMHDTTLQRMLLQLGEASLQQRTCSPLSQRLAVLVQALLASPLTCERVRAQACVCLGKFALRDVVLARKLLALFLCELDTSVSCIVRSNVLWVLCDMSRTYSGIVEPHTMRNVSRCFRDVNVVVRRHALLVTLQLLQCDYIKWRGALFHRFMHTLCDTHVAVRSVTMSYINTFVAVKYRTMFAQHFISMMFYLNSYTHHAAAAADACVDDDGDDDDDGESCAELRQRVYETMLMYMSDEERFNTAAKLVQNVLGDVVDGTIRIDDDDGSENLLRDTLIVLASSSMKMSSAAHTHTMKKNIDDDDDDDDENNTMNMRQARSHIMSHIVKKNMICNVIPIVVAMKRVLDQHCSPLKKEFMVYMKQLFSDCRAEMKDVLAADRQLSIEIDFDLRQFEQEQKKLKKQRQQTLSAKKITHEQLRRLSISPHQQQNTPKNTKQCNANVFCTPRIDKNRVLNTSLSYLSDTSETLETPKRKQRQFDDDKISLTNTLRLPKTPLSEVGNLRDETMQCSALIIPDDTKHNGKRKRDSSCDDNAFPVPALPFSPDFVIRRRSMKRKIPQ